MIHSMWWTDLDIEFLQNYFFTHILDTTIQCFRSKVINVGFTGIATCLASYKSLGLQKKLYTFDYIDDERYLKKKNNLWVHVLVLTHCFFVVTVYTEKKPSFQSTITYSFKSTNLCCGMKARDPSFESTNVVFWNYAFGASTNFSSVHFRVRND